MSPSVKPFNEVEYKALMDGLECTEIPYTIVCSGTARLDSEYYKKTVLQISSTIDKLQGNIVEKLGGIVDCSAFYPSITGFYSNDRSNIPFLRVNEIQNGLISITDDTVFLPQSVLDQNKKTIAIAYPGDIIIAKGGNTLAKVGLVTDEFEQYATCRDVIILRTNKLTINKYYVWAFFHSKYGQGLLWRSASQTGQPHITLQSIQMMKIPSYSDMFQTRIMELYNNSTKAMKQAAIIYQEAEILMESLLGIEKETYKRISSFSERKLSESFAASGRIDAEYYRPKYDVILHGLEKHETTIIPKEFDILKNSYSGYSETMDVVGVIKTKQVGNPQINTAGIESTVSEKCVQDNNLITLKQGDVVFAAMGVGSLGRTGIFVEEDQKKYVTDSTLRIFRKKEHGRIHPEVLALFLQSDVGQELIYRYIVGSTGIINIYDSDIAKLPIPVLKEEEQDNIVQKVQEFFKAGKRAKELLGFAKSAVEMAIEQGEQTAIDWLKDKGIV